MLSGVGGQCLTDPHNSRHAGVRLTAAPCDGSPAQQWSTFSHWNIGQHNGLWMDTTGSPYTKPGLQPGDPVRLAKCAGEDHLWFPCICWPRVMELLGIQWDQNRIRIVDFGGPDRDLAMLAKYAVEPILGQDFGNGGSA